MTTTDAQALGERMLTALIGAAELFTIELGRELGLYAALRDRPLAAAELAKVAASTSGMPGNGSSSRPRPRC